MSLNLIITIQNATHESIFCASKSRMYLPGLLVLEHPTASCRACCPPHVYLRLLGQCTFSLVRATARDTSASERTATYPYGIGRRAEAPRLWEDERDLEPFCPESSRARLSVGEDGVRGE
jgi:hypothetical protein